jgi:DNA-directed RNA polymerase sigma subunit (sigma70/sigma32)
MYMHPGGNGLASTDGEAMAIASPSFFSLRRNPASAIATPVAQERGEDYQIRIDREAGEATVSDFVPDEGAADPSEAADVGFRREYARRLLATLPGRDRAMVKMRFGFDTGIPATLREVGKTFGVSTARADKVIGRALLRLRAVA